MNLTIEDQNCHRTSPPFTQALGTIAIDRETVKMKKLILCSS